MPISTVPNTPAHHSSGGMETIMRSPQARARSRWSEQKGISSPASGAANGDDLSEGYMEGDEEQTKLLANNHATASVNAVPSPSSGNGERKRSRVVFCLLLLLLVIIGGVFLHDQGRVQVTDWIDQVSSTYLAEEHARPEVRSQWQYVTGTSPFAVEKACIKHSAHKMHDAKVVVVESVENILAVLKQRYERGESLVVCGPPPMDMRELKRSSITVVVYVENGLQAAFDPSYVIWSRVRGMDHSVEEAIDESCLERRIKTRRKYNCVITEIGILRAAERWSRLGEEARALQTFQMENLVDSNPFALKSMNRTAHQILIDQLLQTHLRHFDGSQVSVPLKPLTQFPDRPLAPVVDSGYCKLVYRGTEPEYLGPKVTCLPNFIIFGAQKSGTDELSVWLNRNRFNRRMDGGVELHFFDCVGRGIGVDRFSCDRKRSYLMMDHQTESREVLLPNMTNDPNIKPTDFSWAVERLQTPFLDDGIWKKYLRLGHLNNKQFHLEPSRTLVFEKTPSYLDMADPRDVVRLLPRGKFVLLTRDPVPRLLSAYYQFCDNPEADEGPCSIEEFTEFAMELTSGTLDIETPGPRLKRRQSFARAARHGQYADLLEIWTKYFWIDGKNMLDKQFLVVDAHHFRYVPLSVMFVVESFTGNRGVYRHYKYKPHYKNGYYVLGDYSKAFHPSHSEGMPVHVQKALREYYKPSTLKFRAMLENKDGPLQFGCFPGETFPPEDLAEHPAFFNGLDRFSLPPWVKNVTLDASP